MSHYFTRQVARIRSMREEMRVMSNEIRERDEAVRALSEEMAKLPRHIQRGGYTRRIMEIVRNIEKQQAEINRILADTVEIQKEINGSIETLKRSYGSTDELVFKDAKVRRCLWVRPKY